MNTVTVLTMMGRSQTLPEDDAVLWLRETVKSVPRGNREYAVRSRILMAEDTERVIQAVLA